MTRPAILGQPGPPGARGPSEVGLWRPILITTSTFVNGTGGVGVYYPSSGGFLPDAVGNATYPPTGIIRLSNTDLVHPVLDVELRVTIAAVANDTSAGSTFTAGLYPVDAGDGGAGVNALDLGTVIAGSTISPGAITSNEVAHNTGGSFAVPAPGVYSVGVALGVQAVNAGNNTAITLALELRLV